MDYLNKIHVDEVVLIKNPAKPRPFWQLGRMLDYIWKVMKKFAHLRLGKEMSQWSYIA